jgi:hypothetical protein
MYNANTTFITQLTYNTTNDRDAKICGYNVVWQGHDGSDYEVFFYNILNATTTQLSSNAYDDEQHQVFGSKVVWQSYDGNDLEITLAQRKVCMTLMMSDLDGNCQIDMHDYALMAARWLQCHLTPPEACWQ